MKLKDVFSLIFSIIVVVAICGLSYYFRDDIYIFYRDYIIKERDNISLVKNEYYKDQNYLFVQNTDDFIADSEQDIKNIIYTTLNSGSTSFTFYCADEYKECLPYIANISTDNTLLSNINNFVDPYNSFKTINITYSSKGAIKLEVIKNYTEADIEVLNAKIDSIIASLDLVNDTERQKIVKIHNYIIENGKYATKDTISENENESYSKANGILLEGLGTCNSYADAMAIFLDKLGIENYKISSPNHIWNLVKLDNEFLHLDLTWDDPVLSDGSDTLEFIFMLISDTRLKELNVDEHDYDPNVYMELKN